MVRIGPEGKGRGLGGRKPPPDYFARSTQLRLLVMVGALMLVLVLIVCVISAGLCFATMSQLGEYTEWAKVAISGLKTAVQAIPRTL